MNAKGELVEASDELLQGIRGGGGIFGVIVELKIKVYPLSKVSQISNAPSKDECVLRTERLCVSASHVAHNLRL